MVTRIAFKNSYEKPSARINQSYNEQILASSPSMYQDQVSFKGPLETMILKQGPTIPFELMRWFFYATAAKKTDLALGEIPKALAKDTRELKKILYGPYWLTKLKGYFTGKRYERMDGGRYANLMVVRTKYNSFLVKMSKSYPLRNGGYKSIVFPPTGEFVPRVRVGLGYQAMLSYYLTHTGYKNAARFHYYNEPLACMITEHIHSKDQVGTKIKRDILDHIAGKDQVTTPGRYVSQSYLGKEILDKYKIRFVDSSGTPNFVITPEGNYKIIDFSYWTDVIDKTLPVKFDNIRDQITMVKDKLLAQDQETAKDLIEKQIDIAKTYLKDARPYQYKKADA